MRADSLTPLDAFLTPLHTEEHGAWTLRFSTAPTDSDTVNIFTVEILLDGVMKSRTTTARQGLTAPKAVELLRSRALAWVEDYTSRHPNGQTNFAEL